MSKVLKIMRELSLNLIKKLQNNQRILGKMKKKGKLEVGRASERGKCQVGEEKMQMIARKRKKMSKLLENGNFTHRGRTHFLEKKRVCECFKHR